MNGLIICQLIRIVDTRSLAKLINTQQKHENTLDKMNPAKLISRNVEIGYRGNPTRKHGWTPLVRDLIVTLFGTNTAPNHQI